MRRSSKLAERTRLETWVFIVKLQISVSPRFLTESDKETDALPTVIESGKEKERDLDFRPEDTIIASVLSSFSLSLFSVNLILMSSIHFCTEKEVRDLMRGWSRFELRVVSVCMMMNGVLFSCSRKRSCIENEEDRSKD